MQYVSFQPQPVKGAKVYFMHVILHDWPDIQARQILHNVREAIEPGYSKFLLYEVVITSGDPRVHATNSDLMVMVLLAAAERTEAIWRGLLDKAGLGITKIWTSPNATEAIIEAELM